MSLCGVKCGIFLFIHTYIYTGKIDYLYTMPTVVFNAYSKPYPSITNRIRASIFLQSDPQALIAFEIDSTPGHPERVWSFPGLPRNNYGFVLDEIDSFDNPVNNLAYFDAVPSEVEGELVRDDEEIVVDTTPGLVGGASVATFDGTGGSPNYIGWEIVVMVYGGTGFLSRGLDYSWDKTTGVFSLLQVGDQFQPQQIYNIHFNSISNPQGNSYPTVTDFSIRLVQITSSILLDDFANKIIVEPTSEYIELTLPSIVTVPQGRKLMVDVSVNSDLCIKIIPFGSDTINFLRGNIYLMPNESLSIYRYNRDGVNEWRITDCDGNYKTVGQLVSNDSISTNVFNIKLLDGSIESADKYARIYNEIVLNLPLSQRVAYADWLTGTNRSFFSLVNGSNQFHFPDRRGMFERNNNLGIAGTFIPESVGPHSHFIAKHIDPASVINIIDSTQTLVTRRDNGETNAYILSGQVSDADVGKTSLGTGTENVPNNYLTNKYVYV